MGTQVINQLGSSMLLSDCLVYVTVLLWLKSRCNVQNAKVTKLPAAVVFNSLAICHNQNWICDRDTPNANKLS